MAQDGQIAVHCSCGKKLKAPASAVGKKARCPACGAVVRLIPEGAFAPTRSAGTAAARTAVSAPVGGGGKPRTPATAPMRAPKMAAVKMRAEPELPDDSDSDDDGLAALNALSEQAESAAVVPDAAVCPSCRARWQEDAVLCTSCGYDRRTGKSLSTARDAQVSKRVSPWAKRKPSSGNPPQGSFILGLLLACVFGFITGLVWLLAIEILGPLIGMIPSVGLGWLVGLGMRLGQRDCGQRGGIAAAAVAMLSMAGLPLLFVFIALCGAGADRAGQIGSHLFGPLRILAIVMGMAAAFGTANRTA